MVICFVEGCTAGQDTYLLKSALHKDAGRIVGTHAYGTIRYNPLIRIQLPETAPQGAERHVDRTGNGKYHAFSLLCNIQDGNALMFCLQKQIQLRGGDKGYHVVPNILRHKAQHIDRILG